MKSAAETRQGIDCQASEFDGWAHFHSQLFQASEFHLSVFSGVLCILQNVTAALGDFAIEQEAPVSKTLRSNCGCDITLMRAILA
jgi:hypothetical protein